MKESNPTLGKLVGVHGIAPAYLQRAVFIVILSFLFFLAMMVGFYLYQNFVYFLLASAFLLVYLLTLFSWVMQRRNMVKIYENGIEYRKFSCRWEEIEAVSNHRKTGLVIKSRVGRKIVISNSIQGIDEIADIVRSKLTT